jgi:hypothetical protein
VHEELLSDEASFFSGAPSLMARNLVRPLALTSPSHFLVFDMTWFIELMALWSWTSCAVNLLRVGAVSLQVAAERIINRVDELVASVKKIDFHCASWSAVLRNKAVEALRF